MVQRAIVVWLLFVGLGSDAAFHGSYHVGAKPASKLFVATDVDSASDGSTVTLTRDSISKLKWRELQHELEQRELETAGTTASLRQRLQEAMGMSIYKSDVLSESAEECLSLDWKGVSFVDESDGNFEFKELLNEVEEAAESGHWKRASRRLKKLKRKFGQENMCIPPEAYEAVLEACASDRLHGARASETARKIMEEMVEGGYEIPIEQSNFCIRSCLGNGDSGMHDGFGGIDTALAMINALTQQEQTTGKSLVQVESYSKLITALAQEGGDSVAQAEQLLRSVIVDMRETPPLFAFADVAMAHVRQNEEKEVFTVLAYLKAAGYEVGSIASMDDGRRVLAAGVIAAEKMDDVRLGLRLLKAASEASGCAPDRGDVLLSLESQAAQRACTLLHKRAINRAVEDGQWQLGVKLLELMLERSLKPSTFVWRNVVTCCAKNEKSRKAAALLFDWTALYEAGKADIPPITVFNTCVNACEICGEQELTLKVLDAMKKTHDTEGTIITFNIALKRLAKLGNYWAAEGIIVGMIENGVEPTVVSYTTAIAACAASEPKQPTLAREWMNRMRSRGVFPNIQTYNTALSACLDGSYESTLMASTLASKLREEVDLQLLQPMDKKNEYTDLIPNYNTKATARLLMKQLKQHWIDGLVEKDLAVSTIRVPFLDLVNFSKSSAAKEAVKQDVEKKAEAETQQESKGDVDAMIATNRDEVELEFLASHRTAEI